eukprot:2120343-Rhodomonas_salina.2
MKQRERSSPARQPRYRMRLDRSVRPRGRSAYILGDHRRRQWQDIVRQMRSRVKGAVPWCSWGCETELDQTTHSKIKRRMNPDMGVVWDTLTQTR